MYAGVVGPLAALLVPGAGHSAEVVQDAAAAAMPLGHEGGGTGREQPSGLEILSTARAVNEPSRSFTVPREGPSY